MPHLMITLLLPLSSNLFLSGPMNRPQICCDGCDKVFTPHGFSQHLTKNVLCRATQMVLQTPLVFQSMLAEGSLSNSTSWDKDPVNGYNVAPFSQDASNIGPNTTQATSGTHTTDDAELTNTPDTANNAKHADAINTTDATDTGLLTKYGSITSNTSQDHPNEAPLVTQPAVPPVEHNANQSEPLMPLVIDRFPHSEPGAPVCGGHLGSSCYQRCQEAFGDSIWAPFSSLCEWVIARWAKMRGLMSSAMEELLAIPEVVDKLSLSFSSSKELNEIINALPGRPSFECHTFFIGGESLELYFQDVLSCIRSIYGDPAFAQDLVVTPEWHYTDQEQMKRVYSKMHTGDWWWAVQADKRIPYIIQLATSPRIFAKSQHAVLRFCLPTSQPPNWKALPISLVATVHLQTCTMLACTGNVHLQWPMSQARDIYALADGNAHAFHLTCCNVGQKPVYCPFWETLPLTNVFISITPDILHQLLQGVVKHLVTWVIAAFRAADIDK
ncbi:hypothetical protein EI94DRAFT_1701828 [Lactarius quietus]|nr:hypothetical protein EI94DRAFT_1701828 [Lactarius quietus]